MLNVLAESVDHIPGTYEDDPLDVNYEGSSPCTDPGLVRPAELADRTLRLAQPGLLRRQEHCPDRDPPVQIVIFLSVPDPGAVPVVDLQIKRCAGTDDLILAVP